ncbi:glutathione S-transferase family protein [Halomonas halmophila]|uniref:Glutathione S-transferase n=1 Tax=Halomonas halmophila TaxID=252 RepID=A0A4Y4F2K2_9GAMM|nr:glutathione S-transferase family protein [Halomonas halmophila]GED21810.1 glutathione S-transferase [Halomonas halmophila]
MPETLVFYTNPLSRSSIVHWMLEEVGADYRMEVLEFGDAMKSPAYLAINPMGKVPAIRHGDTVVTEAAAICAYLADAFPEAGLAPAPAERGEYYRWLFFAAGPLEAAVSLKGCGFQPTPEQERMLGFGRLEQVLETLEGAVDGKEYIAGNRFSAADVYVASHLSWGMQFGTIEKRPAFEAYCRGLETRTASRRVREHVEREMAAKGWSPD